MSDLISTSAQLVFIIGIALEASFLILLACFVGLILVGTYKGIRGILKL